MGRVAACGCRTRSKGDDRRAAPGRVPEYSRVPAVTGGNRTMTEWMLAIYPASPLAASFPSEKRETGSVETDRRSVLTGLAVQGLIAAAAQGQRATKPQPAPRAPATRTPEHEQQLAELLAWIGRANVSEHWRNVVGPQWLPKTATEHTQPGVRFRHLAVEPHPPRAVGRRPTENRLVQVPPPNPAIVQVRALAAKVAPTPRTATGPVAIRRPKRPRVRRRRS